MGKSCLFYSEGLDAYYYSADNLVMAKKMHDLGKPIPGSCIFSVDRYEGKEGSLFYKAISILFDSELTYEKEEEEETVLTLKVPAVSEWLEFERDNGWASAAREWITKPLERMCCPRFELEAKAEIISTGLRLKIEGYYGMLHTVLENLIEFYQRLQQKLEEWSGKEKENGRDDQGRFRYSLRTRHDSSHSAEAV